MKLSRRIQQCLNVVLCVGGVFVCSHVFADECATIANNAAWNEGMSTLSDQISKKKWDDALKTAENLNTICERSPILNYAMGRIHKEKGNDSKSLYYMQRATLYTEEFAVKGKTLEQMWFDRYEAEHPEARPDAIEALKKENARLKAQALQTHDKAMESRIDAQADLSAEKSRYGAGLWIGVAVAGVGLALTGTGAGLVIANNDDTIGFNKSNDDSPYEISPYTKSQNNTYWGVLGAGIAATVVGVTLMGVFGYWYAHTDVQDSNNTISFYNTSNGIGIRF